MIRIDVNEVILALHLQNFGAQGWMQDKSSSCPYCGSPKKWGVKLSPVGGVFHCWKCSVKKPLKDYLYTIGKQDLIQVSYENTESSSLTPLIEEEEEETPVSEMKEVSLPFRLKRIEKDPYLDERGWQPIHYNQYEPSETKSPLCSELKNYIVFKMKMDGKVIAWLARSRHSKEWHKRNLEQAKLKNIKPKLRYENSSTDFTKVLGGYDELSSDTKTVIIVEGIMDKVGVDNLLHLWEDETIKCVFTFGNSISDIQISYLKKKGIEKAILMYDDGTEEQSKSAGLILSKHLETKIAHLYKPKIDPGDMDLSYMEEVLDNLYDPINFYTAKIPSRW